MLVAAQLARVSGYKYTCQSLPNLVESLDTNIYISRLVAAKIARVSRYKHVHASRCPTW